MIRVYFESENNSCADLVAVFDTEETYSICLPALEASAKEIGMIVTEGVDEEIELSSIVLNA